MLFEWSLVTFSLLLVIFVVVKMFYFKNLTIKEQRNNDVMKLTLKEAEVLIRKYQIQLQRALGNIDILNEQMNKLRREIKALKQRNSQYRIENEKLKSRIKELESRIEALI
jgi:peptidoglycan hydrolase CwlO-like protein